MKAEGMGKKREGEEATWRPGKENFLPAKILGRLIRTKGTKRHTHPSRESGDSRVWESTAGRHQKHRGIQGSNSGTVK